MAIVGLKHVQIVLNVIRKLVHVSKWTVFVRVSLAMNACIVRMGFVSEPVPTRKSAAAINVSTQVNMDAVVGETHDIHALRERNVVLAANPVVIQRCRVAAEVNACPMATRIAANADRADQIRCVVSGRRGRSTAVMLRQIALDSVWGWQVGEKDCWLRIATSSPANSGKQRELTLCLVLSSADGSAQAYDS